MNIETSLDFHDHVLTEKVIIILRGLESEPIIKIAEILTATDLHLLEITCNTPNAFEIIQSLSTRFKDELLIGAGTVVSVPLAKSAMDAGAKYMVTPNLDEDVIKFCQGEKIPIIPGVATPTEIYRAVKLGLTMVKLFPIGSLGGSDYIKQIRGPIDNINILATGGVNTQNAMEILKAGADAIGMGVTLFDQSLITQNAWEAIEDRVKHFAAQIRHI